MMVIDNFNKHNKMDNINLISARNITNYKPKTYYYFFYFHLNRGPQRRGAGIKTDGNIARLSADDDDDENNTWNGNSTQQM